MELSRTAVCEQRDNEISISGNPAIFHAHAGMNRTDSLLKLLFIATTMHFVLFSRSLYYRRYRLIPIDNEQIMSQRVPCGWKKCFQQCSTA